MTAVLISPVFNQSSFDGLDGHLLAGGKIFAYNGGSSSTLKDTYSTSLGDVANTNPIVLNSSGQLTTSIWLIAGETYNLVLTKADGTTVLKGFDGVTGVSGAVSSGGGGGGGTTTGIWVLEAGGTFLSSTSFLVTGNKTTEFYTGNRVRLTQSGGYTYGVVVSSTFVTTDTSVTIVNDGPALNSSLSAAEWSLNVTNGKTVDAGSVSFFDGLSYSTSNTVGNKINTVNSTLTASIASTEAKRARDDLVQTAAGGSPAYTVSPTPAISAYTVDQVYVIKFVAANTGSPTLNISGLGAKNLVQYSSAGAKIPAAISAGMVSQVAYDGTDLILLDPLPLAVSAPPHGWQAFASNGTFTVPANVYSVKITTVGGGGGGGAGYSVWPGGDSGGLPTYYKGGNGGLAAASWNIVATTPGTTYSVSVGIGGAAGASGGTSAFGITLCTAAGGFAGGNAAYGDGTNGAVGSTGTGFVIPGGASAWGLYGQGGAGGIGDGTGSAGSSGVVVLEW
jgi:hypothetical protein